MTRTHAKIVWLKPKDPVGGHFTAEELRLLNAPMQAMSTLENFNDCIERRSKKSHSSEQTGGSPGAPGAALAIPGVSSFLPVATSSCITPELREARRMAIDEAICMHSMHAAFLDTAKKRLVGLDTGMRESGNQLNDALHEAYPPHVKAAYKAFEGNRRARNFTGAALVRAMLSSDLAIVDRLRDHQSKISGPLREQMPSLSDAEQYDVIYKLYCQDTAMINILGKDLLCENLTDHWCIDLQRQSRRLIPQLLSRQLDILEPWVAPHQRQARVRMPNLDAFVETVPGPPRRKVSTLPDAIAISGAQWLETRAASATPTNSAARRMLTSSESSSDTSSPRPKDTSSHPSSGSESDYCDAQSDVSDEENLYALPPEKPIAPLPRAERRPARRLRFAKQKAPESVAQTQAGRSQVGSVQASNPGTPGPLPLGRHKAKHRSGAASAKSAGPSSSLSPSSMPAQAAAVTPGQPSAPPKIKLGEKHAKPCVA